MNTEHMIPIVTNARQGRALSTRNRPRRTRAARLLILLGCLLFWAAVAYIAASL